MTFRRYHFLATAAVLAATIAAPAMAQQAGLQITVVRDADGTPVARAEVTVSNTDIGLSRTLTTDANGQVTFTSIFPGCYDGRFPHIHFEVYPSLAKATSYANRVLTSQFAMPTAACNTVYATSGYSSSKTNFAKITTSSDNVFGDNTSAQVAAMTPTMTGDTTNGFTGTVTVGIAI